MQVDLEQWMLPQWRATEMDWKACSGIVLPSRRRPTRDQAGVVAFAKHNRQILVELDRVVIEPPKHFMQDEIHFVVLIKVMSIEPSDVVARRLKKST